MKRRITLHHSIQAHTGSALFFAIIMAGMFLLIAISLSEIALKEAQFSRFSRDSQTAFYAADSGIECALYWDYVHSSASVFRHDRGPKDFECLGQNKNSGNTTFTSGSNGNWEYGTTTFSLQMPQANNRDACVRVSVGKYEHTSSQKSRTLVVSRGLNANNTAIDACIADAQTSRQTARVLEAKYGF